MKTRLWPRLAISALLVALAGCGGGGGGGSTGAATVPQTPTGGAAPQGHMVIAIPGTTSSAHTRRPFGIPPTASSISITVTGISTPQVADISATSPNCASASGGGRTCTIPVQAQIGLSEVFTISIFDGAGATGNLLGVGTATAQVFPSTPFSVNITLQGVIKSLQFVIGNKGGSGGGGAGAGASPSPGPGATPPIGSGSNSSSIGPPVGQPASGIGTVAAQDASGNFIVGPFNTTVTITADKSGVTFVPATLTGSAPITFSYDGVQTQAITLTATAAATASTPVITTTKVVLPSTSLTLYTTPTLNPVFMHLGPDGQLYMGEFGVEGIIGPGLIGGIGPGKIARFDPVAKAFTGEVTTGVNPLGFAWAPDGSIFNTNQLDNPSSIGHIVGFSTYTSNPVPSNGSFPRPIVQGADGNMWFAEARGSGAPLTANIAKFNPASPATITEMPLPSRAHIQDMAVGPDHNFYLTDSANGNIYQVTTAGVITTFPIPGAVPFTFNVFPRFVTAGPDGNMWISDLGNNAQPGGAVSGNLWKLTTAGVFTKVSMPVSYAGPDSIVSGGSAGVLYFSDLSTAAVGVVTTAGAVTEYPIVQGCASFGGTGFGPDGIAVAPDGSVWYTGGICTTPPASPTAGYLVHFQLGVGWTLFPLDDTIYLSPGIGQSASQLIGMAESGDSSPFTVVSNNPSVASVATTSSSHNFIINAVTNGTTMITVTDAHGNSLTKNVVVTSATGSISSVGRRIP